MNREETKKRIKQIQKQLIVESHFANGGDIAHRSKNEDTCWIKTENPSWDWDGTDYTTVGGLPEPNIMKNTITKSEKECITRVIVKNKETGSVSKITFNDVEHFTASYLFLNPSTQCWEEWSEDLEKELLK